jgi:hypothetical protein
MKITNYVLLISSMVQTPSWKVYNFSRGQEISSYYRTRKFIALFIKPDTGPYHIQLNAVHHALFVTNVETDFTHSFT